MKFIFTTFLLILIFQKTVFSKNIVKRDCCTNCDFSPCSTTNCQTSSCNTVNCQTSPCRTVNCQTSPCSNTNCQTSQCSNTNNNNNDKDDTVPVLVPFPPANQIQPSTTGSTNLNNTNINNSTIDISLINTVNTVNNISVPISLNSTNLNTISVFFTTKDDEEKEEEEEKVEEENLELEEPKKCCFVVGPKICNENQNCYHFKKWECSELCDNQILPDPVVSNTTIPATTTTTQKPPQPIYPYPQPQPIPYPQPIPIPQPQPFPYPQPQPIPYPQPQPIPYPQPQPIPQPQPFPYPQPQPIPYPQPIGIQIIPQPPSGCQQPPIYIPPNCPQTQLPIYPPQIQPIIKPNQPYFIWANCSTNQQQQQQPIWVQQLVQHPVDVSNFAQLQIQQQPIMIQQIPISGLYQQQQLSQQNLPISYYSYLQPYRYGIQSNQENGLNADIGRNQFVNEKTDSKFVNDGFYYPYSGQYSYSYPVRRFLREIQKS